MIPTSAASKGQLAEISFMQKVVELGGQVSKPIASESQYDFIVDFKSKLQRIQVKSTWLVREDTLGEHYILKASSYSKETVDFIVCYIQPTNSWYIIPIEDLRSSYIRISKQSQYAQHLEAWDLLYT